MRLQIIKNSGKYKKGQIVELRSREAKELLKNSAAMVQTDIGTENIPTKGLTNDTNRN